jgi:hypothetical protein
MNACRDHVNAFSADVHPTRDRIERVPRSRECEARSYECVPGSRCMRSAVAWNASRDDVNAIPDRMNVNRDHMNVKRDDMNVKRDDMNARRDHMNARRGHMNAKRDHMNAKRGHMNASRNDIDASGEDVNGSREALHIKPPPGERTSRPLMRGVSRAVARPSGRDVRSPWKDLTCRLYAQSGPEMT